MRAAVLTTALVISVLAFWASVREAGRVADVAAAGVLPSIPTPRSAALASDAPAAREHVVATGESLEEIASLHYGDPARADAIREANRDRIGDPAQLEPGLRLRIP